jgi:hypothetical protein
LTELIGDGLVMLLKGLAQLVLGSGINEQSQAHDHDQGHQPSELLQKETIGKEGDLSKSESRVQR